MFFRKMDIYVYGKEGSLTLTFRDKTIASKIKDLSGRTIGQTMLLPLSVIPSKKVLSDINLRMNIFTVDGNFKAIEQNIRLEVEQRSRQEQELLRFQRMFQSMQSTIEEIAHITQRL
jgi:hypothetical protein